MDKTVLITGAGGFIGLNTVNFFRQNGWKVIAVVHKNVPKELDDVEKAYADLSDKNSIARMWENLSDKPQTIVHIAGLASDIGTYKLFEKINFNSVKNLASLPIKKFVYVSTMDVYGIKDFNGEKEEELSLLEFPKNPYPHFKIKSEEWLRKNCTCNYVILRPAAVWGENDKTLEKRAVDFLRTSPFIVHFGKWKGKNRWPLADVKNVAKVVLAVSQSDKYDNDAITIIDAKKTTIDDWYRDLASKYFPEKRFKTLYLPLWVGKLIGAFSTSLSNLLNKTHPIFDPSFYAVHHVSSNLDLSSEKMEKIISEISESSIQE